MVNIPGRTRDENGRRPLRIGYVPLIDCAPLVVAQEEGLFRKHDVPVRLSREPGWASVRDKLVYRELDAAQCLAGLVIALNYGLEGLRQPLLVPLILNANGNGITLSKDIDPREMRAAGGLKAFLQNRGPAAPLLKVAAVHRYSSHYLLLQNWLKREGLKPGRDAEIIFLPPPLTPRNLAAGTIDGFCVGEPWNSHAIMEGIGWCVATSVDISSGHPEKVLAVNESVQHERGADIHALTAALLEACQLCADPGYRDRLVALLSSRPYLDTAPATILNSLASRFQTGAEEDRVLPDFHLFYGPEINAPTLDKANWVVTGMRQSGLLGDDPVSGLNSVFRTDLFDAAAAALKS